MSDDATLMAHLIPRITNQVEDAATDALGYILNGSAAAREALTDLLREGGFAMPPIARVATQVEEDDGSRPDMTGYDENGVKRLLVESKFWAALQERQASGYLQRLNKVSPPTALLFIAPDARLETLWAAIVRQIGDESPETALSPATSESGWRSAMVDGVENRRLALVSWDRLLRDMSARAADDDGAVANIRQLRGLTQSQDGEAFLPIRAEELSPEFARRAVGYTRLVDDVVARGVSQGWMSIENLQATSRRYGYGRYFWLVETGDEEWESFWFGVNHVRWARRGDTPLWMRRYSDGKWLPPIYLKLGVEYHEVLDDVTAQVKEMARTFGADAPG